MKKRNVTTIVRILSILTAAGLLASPIGCEDGPTKVENARLFELTVRYSSGGPVRGASVRIPLDGADYIQQTDEGGACSFQIANEVALPEYVIATIDHASIMPEAVTFPGAADMHSEKQWTCDSAPSTVYVRDVSLHHLGNDQYSGSANSQLQIESEGVSRTYRFSLDQAPGRMPKIRLYARGVEHPTEIRINGTTTNRLGDSNGSGDLSHYDFRLNGTPSSLLHGGTNSLTIHTAPYTDSDPWDDIEFCSMILYFD